MKPTLHRPTGKQSPGEPLGPGVFEWPSTTLGWWSVALAGTFAVLFIINAAVFMPSIVQIPRRQEILPFYGIGMFLIGFAAGVAGLVALMRQHEHSLLVWLAVLPGLFVAFFLIGEFLFPH